ncbi:MAG: cytoplasmic protein [Hyphomicrobiales bacterium]|nr:cytoplasmic protein [Hyphomicrobiales bacterium]
MDGLRHEIAAFLRDRNTAALQAGQLAALQIACHLDLAGALQAEGATRARIVLKLERMIERERLRGARRHWSYDLNRHIALKQALDRLRPGAARPEKPVARHGAKRKRRPEAPSQTEHSSRPT